MSEVAFPARGSSLAQSRPWLSVLVFSVVTSIGHSARADVEACVGFHERGQTERNSGQLSAARADFLSCADADCPELVRNECAQFLAQIEAQLASVVFEARDADGALNAKVSVMVDGQAVLDHLDGTAQELDPGEHAVVFTWPDGYQKTQQLVLRTGERNAKLTMRRDPPPAPAAPPERARATKRSPILAYTLGGVGLAAVGTFVGFALAGKSTQSDLDACKPKCRPADVDKMRSRFLIGDIALAIGAAALGGATYVYVTQPSTEPQAASAGLELRGSF